MTISREGIYTSGSLMELAGIWKHRKDADKRFKEILKDREKFKL